MVRGKPSSANGPLRQHSSNREYPSRSEAQDRSYRWRHPVTELIGFDQAAPDTLTVAKYLRINFPSLSPQAQLLLALRADGYTREEIADRLECSVRTVTRRFAEAVDEFGEASHDTAGEET